LDNSQTPDINPGAAGFKVFLNKEMVTQIDFYDIRVFTDVGQVSTSETLHFVLGDMFEVRCGLQIYHLTLLFTRVAQSEAKGLPMAALQPVKAMCFFNWAISFE